MTAIDLQRKRGVRAMLVGLVLGALTGAGTCGFRIGRRVPARLTRGRTCQGCGRHIEKAAWPCRNHECPRVGLRVEQLPER